MSDERMRAAERSGDAVRALRERERVGQGLAVDVWGRDAGWHFLGMPRGLMRYEIAAMRHHRIGTPSLKIVTIQ